MHSEAAEVRLRPRAFWTMSNSHRNGDSADFLYLMPRHCSGYIIHYVSSPTNITTIPAFIEPQWWTELDWGKNDAPQRLSIERQHDHYPGFRDRDWGAVMLWDFRGLLLFSSRAGSNPITTLRASDCEVIMVLAKEDVQWISWGWHFASLDIRNGELWSQGL